MDETLDAVAGSVWFSILDIKSDTEKGETKGSCKSGHEPLFSRVRHFQCLEQPAESLVVGWGLCAQLLLDSAQTRSWRQQPNFSLMLPHSPFIPGRRLTTPQPLTCWSHGPEMSLPWPPPLTWAVCSLGGAGPASLSAPTSQGAAGWAGSGGEGGLNALPRGHNASSAGSPQPLQQLLPRVNPAGPSLQLNAFPSPSTGIHPLPAGAHIAPELHRESCCRPSLHPSTTNRTFNIPVLTRAARVPF
ncbi:signal peptidase complex subunit 3 isoform X1 [Mauremys mutica]|uniref:signal peptidase complex subunit 3 isoform X1 n=1 Tax=Mauremys mutica TaxID=74926 RepID=UPI001D1630F4|nr:signal peptidase complex subunit 3 isoform X1 [Mauremys mutica]